MQPKHFSRARLKGKWLTKNFKKQIIVMLHNIFIKWKYMCNVVRIVKQAPRSVRGSDARNFAETKERKAQEKGNHGPAWEPSVGKTPNDSFTDWKHVSFPWLVSCTTLFWMRNSQTRPRNHQWEETRSMKRKPRQVGTTPTGVGPFNISRVYGLLHSKSCFCLSYNWSVILILCYNKTRTEGEKQNDIWKATKFILLKYVTILPNK